MSDNSDSTQLHQRLVLGLVDYLKGLDWEVVHVAGVGGYREPFEIGGYTPDIIAKRADGLLAVGEAATCDVLSDEKTMKQFTAFSDLSTTNDKREVPFFVVVPESCGSQLEDIISSKYSSRIQRITRVKMSGV